MRLARRRIELRWWWEGRPAGDPVEARSLVAARTYLARLGAEPERLFELRSFLRRGAPGFHRAPDDDELLDQLAAAVASGRALLAELPAEPLRALDTDEVEEPIERIARPAPEPAAPPEEICWPCQEAAAASARALAGAAETGVPFIAAD
jgi:hypothetical protein